MKHHPDALKKMVLYPRSPYAHTGLGQTKCSHVCEAPTLLVLLQLQRAMPQGKSVDGHRKHGVRHTRPHKQVVQPSELQGSKHGRILSVARQCGSSVAPQPVCCMV